MGSIPWSALVFLTLYLQLLGMSDAQASALVALFLAGGRGARGVRAVRVCMRGCGGAFFPCGPIPGGWAGCLVSGACVLCMCVCVPHLHRVLACPAYGPAVASSRTALARRCLRSLPLAAAQAPRLAG